jgi:hypothetical protein
MKISIMVIIIRYAAVFTVHLLERIRSVTTLVVGGPQGSRRHGIPVG